ncbi:MAG: hypothetical protein ACXAE3_03150 [Candidatus Kariarchaeaceae archaeon]
MSFSASDVYQLLMVFSRLDPIKSNIILILAHVAPQKVSGAELTQLLGYSQKARTIYRGVLDELEDEGYIIVSKRKNQYSIGIDQNHPLVKRLYELVLTEGTLYTNQLVDKLEDL